MSTAALAVLREPRAFATGSETTFRSARRVPLPMCLGTGAAPRGFRSSFHDWVAGCSGAPRVCELALAHLNTNRIETVYQRTDLSSGSGRSWSGGPLSWPGPKALDRASGSK